MKKLFLLPLMGMLLMSAAEAFDSSLLFNNKEAHSRLLSKRDKKFAGWWVQSLGMSEEIVLQNVRMLLQKTLDEFEKRDYHCDLGMKDLMLKNAKEMQLIEDEDDYYSMMSFLRDHNLIDDIFLKLQRDSLLVSSALEYKVNPVRPYVLSKEESDLDLKKLYEPFKTWPDEINGCSIGRFNGLIFALKWKNTRDRDAKVQRLNLRAYHDKVISLDVFQKLEALRTSQTADWPIYTAGYLEVVANAKDKLAKQRETSTDNKFNQKYASRKEKLTQRARLYQNFDSTQIIMLSDIIERAAKRIDAKTVTLTFEFSGPEEERENYVLSPMEQYRISIKMLRKEMAELMRSDNFKGKSIEYVDLVAAAFETGMVKSQELDYIVRFEDFWNPKTPKWKKYADFGFSIVGTAAFYLPPPWNVMAAIGLVVTESAVMKGNDRPDEDDNWNVII